MCCRKIPDVAPPEGEREREKSWYKLLAHSVYIMQLIDAAALL